MGEKLQIWLGHFRVLGDGSRCGEKAGGNWSGAARGGDGRECCGWCDDVARSAVNNAQGPRLGSARADDVPNFRRLRAP
jgi:hypothetical protein